MSDHAIQRAAERYHQDWTPEDLAEIQCAIARGDAVLDGHLRDNRKRYIVQHRGVRVKVVVKENVAVVVTALPLKPQDRKPLRPPREKRRRVVWRDGKRYSAT